MGSEWNGVMEWGQTGGRSALLWLPRERRPPPARVLHSLGGGKSRRHTSVTLPVALLLRQKTQNSLANTPMLHCCTLHHPWRGEEIFGAPGNSPGREKVRLSKVR